MSRRSFGALLLSLAACKGQTGGGGTAAPPDPLAEARQFLDQGQTDAALARLQGASDAEALVLQGRAWAKKAETAPLPTPPPQGVAPEFKHEELQALEFFERAMGAKPELAAAHLALAQLLGPHAIQRRQAEMAASARRPVRRGATPETALAASGPDASTERVLREYRLAAQGDPTNKAVVEAWVLFATSTGRVDDVDVALRELLRLEKERPEPFVRYGDFLLASKKDPLGAIAQYSQALMWTPDNDAVKAKIADIYLAMAADHLARQQWATADARLKDAQKWVTSPGSPQALKLRELQAQVAQINGRPPGR